MMVRIGSVIRVCLPCGEMDVENDVRKKDDVVGVGRSQVKPTQLNATHGSAL